jgi:hypothetical protein
MTTPGIFVCERACCGLNDAHTCARVCVLTIWLCTACVRGRRSLFIRPSRGNTHIWYFSHNACMIQSMRLSTWRGESPMCARAMCASVCAVRTCVSVCLDAHVSTRQPCEAFPSARTACGSARRRSGQRLRSTRTSAHGTPHRSPHFPRHAPLRARRSA